MNRWFVVQTQANSEAKAQHHLQRQGFVTYLPRYLKRRRHARRVEERPAPLFPRYLFVCFDPLAARWRAIQSTIGVSHLVGQGDRPTAVPETVLRELRAREDASGLFAIDQRPVFAAGDPIRVISGAFADAVGRFHAMSDDDRVTVLLDLLGRQVKTRLTIEAVVANA